jgi:hypothetical protein
MSKVLENLVPELREKAMSALEVTQKVKIVTEDAANDESVASLFGINCAKVVPYPEERIPHRVKEVNEALAECDLLAKKCQQYEQDFIVLGNQALYDLLAGIYAVALKLDKSDFKYEILSKMKDQLKSKDIRVQTNTPDLTVLVKYVVGSDRKRATNYSRILKIALEEHLDPSELANYISRRGGIGEIHETELKAEARELGAKFSKERLSLLREFLSLQQWEKCTEFKYEYPIMQHNSHKQTKTENASFCVFIADYDSNKDVYRIIDGHDLGKTYEDSLLRLIVKDATSDIAKIKKGILLFKKKLLSENLVPLGLAERLKEDIEKTSSSNIKSN